MKTLAAALLTLSVFAAVASPALASTGHALAYYCVAGSGSCPVSNNADAVRGALDMDQATLGNSGTTTTRADYFFLEDAVANASITVGLLKTGNGDVSGGMFGCFGNTGTNIYVAALISYSDGTQKCNDFQGYGAVSAGTVVPMTIGVCPGSLICVYINGTLQTGWEKAQPTWPANTSTPFLENSVECDVASSDCSASTMNSDGVAILAKNNPTPGYQVWQQTADEINTGSPSWNTINKSATEDHPGIFTDTWHNDGTSSSGQTFCFNDSC